MAKEAGIYEALWKPDKINAKTVEDIISILQSGLVKLLENPAFYKKFNPLNGCGSYEGLVEFVTECLDVCEKFPHAEITAHR